MTDIIIHEQSFEGWENLQDWIRDLSECLDDAYNPKAAAIPPDFQGTIKVLVWYVPAIGE